MSVIPVMCAFHRLKDKEREAMDEGFCHGSELILTRYCFLPFSSISFSSFFSLVVSMLLYLLLYGGWFFYC